MSKKPTGESIKNSVKKRKAPNAEPSAVESCETPVVSEIEYVHQKKKNKTTNVEELQEQVDGQVAAMNEIIKKEGMKGLKKRIREYRKSDEVEKEGRKYVKENFESPGESEEGDPLAWLHEPDMACGGKPEDVNRKGIRRNNSILGGQANKIADSILAMDDDTTEIKAKVAILEPE